LELGSFTDVPLLIRTSALLNIIMFVVFDHLRSLFIKYKKAELTKRVNAENTVGQSSKSSKDSALNNDNNFVN